MKVVYTVLFYMHCFSIDVCLLGTVFLLLLSEIHNVEACCKFFFLWA